MIEPTLLLFTTEDSGLGMIEDINQDQNPDPDQLQDQFIDQETLEELWDIGC
jgi:hypothetical protein